MLRDMTQVSRKTGMPPGELVHIGNHKDQPVRMSLFRYSEKDWHEYALDAVDDIPAADSEYITWLSVDGLHDVPLIKSIGDRFKLHPLLLEDILNARQRPKFEEFEDYLYIVFKMLAYNENQDHIHVEQISVVVGPNYVITFLEDPGDLFDVIRDRIRSGKGRVRKMRPDFLAYSMLDVTIDHYFVLLEILHEKIDALQQQILLTPEDGTPKEIYQLRQEALALRKTSWPVRQLLDQMQKSDSALINESLTLYLRDVLDHTMRVTEAVDSIQTMLDNAMETFLSLTNQKTNQVMRFLTVVATIFMPLTFICSVYGMNFDHMPELHWKYSYPILWGILIAVGAGMYYFFRRKKWF